MIIINSNILSGARKGSVRSKSVDFTRGKLLSFVARYTVFLIPLLLLQLVVLMLEYLRRTLEMGNEM